MTATEERLVRVPLGQLLAPDMNPRTRIGATALAELTESVKEFGILQPLLVKEDPKGYKIICGNRRFLAAMNAGLLEVPCVVQTRGEVDDSFAQLVENLQRSDLSAIDEAEAFQRMMNMHGLDREQLAAKIGKQVPYIHARLKLLDLIPEITEALRKGKISTSQADAIARLPYEEQKQYIGKTRAELPHGRAILVQTRELRAQHQPRARPRQTAKPAIVKTLEDLLRGGISEDLLPIIERCVKDLRAAIENQAA